MNYKYKISGEDIILSKEEHESIQKQIKTGRHATITFRNGTIGINTSFVSFFKETDRATGYQEKLFNNELSEAGRLGAPKEMERAEDGMPSYLKTTHNDFYKKMGWEHDRADCMCKRFNI